MDPRKLPIDKRLTGYCTYCGKTPDTRDHAPSKVLLDDGQFEGQLPVVEACSVCNQGFSLDEEYLACFLESVVCGTTDIDKLSRSKIKNIYSHKPKLAKLVQSSVIQDENGRLIWTPEYSRIENVLIKLARGHIAYELNLLYLNEPDYLNYLPSPLIDEKDREEFEKAGSGETRLWPEVGSRAFHRAVGAKPYETQQGPWITIQEQRYRYSVDQFEGVKVQIVLSDYLFCSIVWLD